MDLDLHFLGLDLHYSGHWVHLIRTLRPFYLDLGPLFFGPGSIFSQRIWTLGPFYLTPGPISEGTLDNPGPPISETCPADVAKRIQAVFDEEIKKLYEPVKRELVLETSSQLVNKLVNQFSQPDARLIVDALGQSLNWSKEEQEAFNNTDLGKRSQHVLFSDLMRAMEQLGQRFAQVFPEAFEKTETRLKLEGITKVNEDNWCLEN